MRRVTNTDLWHHYGRNRAERDRTVPESFHWIWSQNGGPGAEALGDLTGQRVVDLGAGSARHAAHLAALHRPAQVVAVDASAAQHAMATDLYAQLTPRLRLVHADVPAHLRMAPHTYDVLYSVFGAVDFTEPRKLLRAAFTALRPGGRLVFSTLAHYLNGEPAEADVVPAEVSAKTPGVSRPSCAAGCSRSTCGRRSLTRPDSPGSTPTSCRPPRPARTRQTHCS